VQDAIGWLLEHARAVRVPLALEPLHPMYAADRACVNTLRQALDICEAVDPANSGALGVAVDTYHVWWDSDVWTQIARAGRKRLLAFHVCDWLVPTKDMLLDRGMMGDGVIDIPAYRRVVEAQGYDGFVEVEILSNDWWSRPLDEVLDTVIARYKTAV
jgi:sugar phosphate isomerase/epimerase